MSDFEQEDFDNEDRMDMMHAPQQRRDTRAVTQPRQTCGGMQLNPSGMSADQIRAVQEVQGRLMLAKSFPRDQAAATQRIMQSCKRLTLAEAAIYTYPKGGTKVEGPSIRLAEALAQAWGNLDCGVDELSQGNGYSKIEAYALDLETNTRFSKKFNVVHERHTRTGVTKLTDPRDIYETVANQGSRRLRACILAAIPGDVVDDAVEACRGTIVASQKSPLSERVKKLAGDLAAYGVTVKMIETRLGHNLPAITEHEWVSLKGIYQSLVDGMSEPGEHFDVGTNQQPAPAKKGTSAAKAQLSGAQRPQAAEGAVSNGPEQPTTAPASDLPEDYLALRAGLIDAYARNDQEAWWASNMAEVNPYELPLTMWWRFLEGGRGKAGWDNLASWGKESETSKAVEAFKGTSIHALIVAEKAAIKSGAHG